MELYFDAKHTYPATLSEVTPTYIAVLPDDPLDKRPYSYAYHTSSKTKARDAYHLGANLEDSEYPGLADDSDCNSLTDVGCTTGSRTWANGFNGSDGKGCGNEAERYCYDVTP